MIKSKLLTALFFFFALAASAQTRGICGPGDNIDPVINCPPDFSEANATGLCNRVVNYGAPVGTDNCPGASTSQSAGIPPGGIFPVGSTTNIFKVTDDNGNIDTCALIITILDTTNPVISCPNNLIRMANGQLCGDEVTYPMPSATDNCPGVILTRISGKASGDFFPVGVHTITYRASDGPNSVICDFTITMRDSISPKARCRNAEVFLIDPGVATITFNQIDDFSSDLCDAGITLVPSPANFDSTDIGTNFVNLIVTDPWGNSDTCKSIVSVYDSTDNSTCQFNIFAQSTNDTTPGITGILKKKNGFGLSAAWIGDIDGNGAMDLALGAPGEDLAIKDGGAVHIIMYQTDGEILSHHLITEGHGGFTGDLRKKDGFGKAVTSLHDMDGDGVPELVVGADGDDNAPGGNNKDRGACYVLFLNSSGNVKSHQKISTADGGFGGTVRKKDRFGYSLASIGDMNQDGVPDFATGAPFDDPGGLLKGKDYGAVHFIFLNSDGTVKSENKLDANDPVLDGELGKKDLFGASVAFLGDISANRPRSATEERTPTITVCDVIIGAPGDDDGASNAGALYVALVDGTGKATSEQKISATEGSFGGTLEKNDAFGTSVATLADMDYNGAVEVAAGAVGDDDSKSGSGKNQGAVWMMYLNNTGTVSATFKLSDTQGSTAGSLNSSDGFGASITSTVGECVEAATTDVEIGTLAGEGLEKNSGEVWSVTLPSAAGAANKVGESIDDLNFVIEADESGLIIKEANADHSSELKSLLLYPNPFADQLNVLIEVNQDTHLKLDLHDQLGRIVSSNKFKAIEGRNNKRIETDKLPNGNYFLLISGNQFRQSLIIQKSE